VSHTHNPQQRIVPLGDRCLVLEAQAVVSREVTLRMRALADVLLHAGLPAVLDLVPAFCSLTIHYDPVRARDPEGRLAPWEYLRDQVERALALAPPTVQDSQRVCEIPVRYGGAYGEDLEALAKAHALAPDEVIELHAGAQYFVGMLGFAPGFPYLAGLDARLVTPRRATPRARVPAGSVAIGGEYTGIYPFESPGGWHVIGRTPLHLFSVSAQPPCRLEPGDIVRFVAVGEEEYKALAREREWR
jgi:inhibitor of KinA